MFTVCVYFLQYSLLEEVRLTAPPDAPNVFLINITDKDAMGSTGCSTAKVESSSVNLCRRLVAAQIATIDGTPLDKIPLEEGARRFLNTQFILTWSRTCRQRPRFLMEHGGRRNLRNPSFPFKRAPLRHSG